MNKLKLFSISLFVLMVINSSPVLAQSPMSEIPVPGTGLTTEQKQFLLDQLGPADKDYDLRLLNMLILQHQAGVVMAQDALKKSQHPEVKKMANSIIATHNKGIEQMKAWRKQWYGQ